MKANIPNILTCCNLICGCIATFFAFYQEFELALLFIVIGAAFDFSDGLAARALNVSSPIGKELDSLADSITFGFAPAAMLFYELGIVSYPEALDSLKAIIPYTAFVLAAYSSLRLAKFNLDTRQSVSFIGLPTPANSLFWASLLTAYGEWFESVDYGFAILLLMMAVSCWLLICEMPMFALKFKSWGIKDGDNLVKYGFVAFSAVLFIASLVAGNAIGSIAFIILVYILVSFIMWITKK